MQQIISPLLRHLYEKNRIKNVFDVPAPFFKSVYLPFDSQGVIQQSRYFKPDTMIDGQNAIIKAIEVVDTLTNGGFNNPDRDNLAISILRLGYLTISDEKREPIAVIPLVNMVRRLNNGRFYLCHFENHVWQNCYIEFTNVASISATVGVQLVVHYEEKRNLN
jgi:hypothetical protein